MYKKDIYTILSNEPLTPVVYRMVLEGDTQYVTRSGQFINIELEGKYLRRPISVSDYDDSTITIIYKVVGRGTEQMRGMVSGQKLDILTGLGNGFNTENEAQRPLLVGGGVGVPPLYNLCKRLLSEGMSYAHKSKPFALHKGHDSPRAMVHPPLIEKDTPIEAIVAEA